MVGETDQVGSTDPKKIRAPWTPQQVRALRDRQRDQTKHPYTCSCGAPLMPTREGWVCSFLFKNSKITHIQQTWAFASDMEPSLVEDAPETQGATSSVVDNESPPSETPAEMFERLRREKESDGPSSPGITITP